MSRDLHALRNSGGVSCGGEVRSRPLGECVWYQHHQASTRPHPALQVHSTAKHECTHARVLLTHGHTLWCLTHSLTQVHLCHAAQRAYATMHFDTARVCPQRRAPFLLRCGQAVSQGGFFSTSFRSALGDCDFVLIMNTKRSRNVCRFDSWRPLRGGGLRRSRGSPGR